MPYGSITFTNPDPFADQHNESPFGSRPTTRSGDDIATAPDDDRNSEVGLLSGRPNNTITMEPRDISFAETGLVRRTKSQKLLSLVRRGRKSDVSKDQKESVRARLSRSMSTSVRAIPRLLVGDKAKEPLPEEDKALKKLKRRESDERWRQFNVEIEKQKKIWEAENKDKVHTRQEPKAPKKRRESEQEQEE